MGNGRNSKRGYRGVCIRRDLRLALYLRDSFRCVYCCQDLHGARPMDITLDHIVPSVDGGTNAPSNLVTTCRACNCSRQDMPLSRFCGVETRKDIRRLTRRSIAKYRRLAKELIAGPSPRPVKVL